jgi:hypothetical protein
MKQPEWASSSIYRDFPLPIILDYHHISRFERLSQIMGFVIKVHPDRHQ